MRKILFYLIVIIALSSFVAGATKILVLNLDRNQDNTGPDQHSSTDAIKPILTQLGYSYDYQEVGLSDHTTLTTINYSKYELVIICAGVNCLFQHAHVFNQQEGQHLVDYLNSGGKVYLEGGDIWYQDPKHHNGYDFGDVFQVTALSDGDAADLYQIHGKKWTIADGLQYDYTDDNCFIDVIAAKGDGVVIFENWQDPGDYPDPAHNPVAVSYDGSVYKTIACSFEFGGLVDGDGNNTKAYLMQQCLDFFGVQPGGGGGETYGDLNADSVVNATDMQLLASYLAGDVRSFSRDVSYADLDQSGAIDVVDIVIMQNYIGGNISNLPYNH